MSKRILVALLLVLFRVTSGHAQTASLSGSVLADSSETPLANAEVSIASLRLSTHSDEKGNFSFKGIRLGKYEVTVRLVGFEPFKAELTFAQNQNVEADFLLTPISTKLKKVEVKGTLVDPRLAEFEARRASPGGGRFFTADVFEKAQGRNISDILLGKIPGLRRVYPKNSNVRPLTGRTDGAHYNCFIAIRLNNQVVYDTSHGDNYFDIDGINTADVIGAEYYNESTIPLQFRATGMACGQLVLWTKG